MSTLSTKGRSRTFDVLIVGGGSSGCALAARLCRRTAASICLIEAGPDYGPWAEERWPAHLLNPGCFPASHDWGFTSVWKTGVEVPEALARVIGGGSSHNQCAAVWGHPADYDEWAEAGNPEWSWNNLQEVAREIDDVLQTRPHSQEQLAPWQRYFLESAIAAGYPRLPSAGVPAPIEGVGPWPATIRHGVRWNTAFAFLDPIRQRQGFTIVPETFAENLVLEGRRATGVRVRTRHGIEVLTARWIILCAGAVGSPVLLMCSGIGPAEELRALNIPVRHDLPGIGRNLHDPGSSAAFVPKPRPSCESRLPGGVKLCSAAPRPRRLTGTTYTYCPTSGRARTTGRNTYLGSVRVS